MGAANISKITLLLLRASNPKPAQVWQFEDEPVVRIGRLADNHVVLYSSVVSRHHVELRRTIAGWDAVSLGSNGTYVDGKRIDKLSVKDGMVLCIADTGPHLQIRLGDEVVGPDGAEIRPARSKVPKPAGPRVEVAEQANDLDDEDGDNRAPSTFLRKQP